jgi:glycerol uptake facilitator protein
MKVSGQLNPAVTIALYWHGKIPLKKVIPFIVAQILGAFLASVVVYWNYNNLIH